MILYRGYIIDTWEEESKWKVGVCKDAVPIRCTWIGLVSKTQAEAVAQAKEAVDRAIGA